MSNKKHWNHHKKEREKKRKKLSCYLSEQQAILWRKLKEILNVPTDAELLDRLIIDTYREANRDATYETH